MVTFRCGLPSKTAVTLFRWDAEIHTFCCCCFCYQPCFRAFGEYPERQWNKHLLLALAYYFFGEQKQQINICFVTVNLKQLFPSTILRMNCFSTRQKTSQTSVTLSCDTEDFLLLFVCLFFSTKFCHFFIPLPNTIFLNVLQSYLWKDGYCWVWMSVF